MMGNCENCAQGAGVADDKNHGSASISAFCPVYHHAMELIGRRWTGAIVRAMLSGSQRFSDIAASVPGLSARLLSERLKELEIEGIVRRTVTPSTPVRVDYVLTAKGKALSNVIVAVSEWAETWVAVPNDAKSTHDR